jgi:TetR/AcrR family transcriptional regulator
VPRPPTTGRSVRILAAAELDFARYGFAGSRMDRIAAAAGVNKALLYYYYPDKRHLYRAVLRRSLEGLLAATTEAVAPADGSAREALHRFVEGYLAFAQTHRHFFRLMQREFLEASSERRWIVQAYLRPLFRRLTDLLRQGIRSGEFRKVDVEQAAFSILGATGGYFAAATAWGQCVRRNLLTPAAIRARRIALLDFLDHALVASEGKAQ